MARKSTMIAAFCIVAALVPTMFASNAAAATRVIRSGADTWVSLAAPSSRHGSDRWLRVQGGTKSRSVAYLRFEVPTLDTTLASARLRLWVTDPTSGTLQLRDVGARRWSERIRWTNRPAYSQVLATFRGPTRGRWITIDVTDEVKDVDSYGWALSTGSHDAAAFGSRESARAPRLVITTSSDDDATDDDSGNDSGDDDTVDPGTDVDSDPTTEPTPDRSAPSTVPNVRASLFDSSTALVEWDAATDDTAVTAYLVSVVGSGAPATVVNPAGRAQLIANLSPSTQYGFVVRARDAAGNMSFTAATASVTTPVAPLPDTTAPTAPGSASASATSSTAITLTWTASTDAVGVTNYLVYRNGGATAIATLSGDTLTYNDSSLAPSTAYSYTVKARDATGNLSNASNTTTATTNAAPDTTAPTTPTSPSANVSGSSVTVSWTASTDAVGVTQYVVRRDGSQVATLNAPTTSWVDSGRPAGTYSYTIAARDAAGNQSAFSPAATATVPPSADTTAPTVPGSVTATASGATGVSLGWNASTDAVGVTQYVVRRDGVQVATVAAPTTTWSETGLDQDREYVYTVTARDAAGNESAQSSAATVHTYNPPGANLPIRYDLASITGTKYFVATNGSNSNAGTSAAAPLLTLGAAMGKVGSGQSATIIVRGGVYRGDANRNGFGKTLHIMAYPGEVPVFNGAMQIDGGWTADGSLAYHSYTAQPVTDGSGITFTTGQNLTGDYIGRNPDQVWIGSTQLRQVSAKASVVDGTFWVDSSTTPNRLYLTATDAAKSNLEASNLDWFLDLGGASSSIEGIRITRYSNSADDYGVLRVTYGASNAVVDNVEVSQSAFMAMTVSGNLSSASYVLVHPVLRDITVSDSNWMGIGVTFADDSVIDHALITRSNMFDEFSYSPQSGAIKTSRLRRMDITGSDILENHSHGIWFDQSNVDMDVVGNRIIDQRGNGVFFEISDDMLLADNYIRNYSGEAAAVKIAGSSGVKMVNNTIVGGNDTVGIYTDSRSMPGCAVVGQPLCAGSYASERDSLRTRPDTLDWMPRVDLMLNNIITDPTGQSYCGRPTPVCVTISNASATAPIETIFHQAEPGRGIPQTVVDGNVFSNSTNGTSLLVAGGTNITTLAAWITKLGTAPINLPGMEAAGRSGSSWVNSDGTPTAALNAVQNQAAAVPTDSAVNEYIPAGTRHYGAINTGP